MAEDVRAHLSENVDLVKESENTAVPCTIVDKDSFFNWGADDDKKSTLNRMDERQVAITRKYHLSYDHKTFSEKAASNIFNDQLTITSQTFTTQYEMPKMSNVYPTLFWR